MTDKIPEPSAGDIDMDLNEYYRFITTTSGNGRLIMALIRRAYHAERKLAALQRRLDGAEEVYVAFDGSHSPYPVGIGSNDGEACWRAEKTEGKRPRDSRKCLLVPVEEPK